MTRPNHAFSASLKGTEQLREKLIGEITRFERQLDALKASDEPVDFSMMQTYKELIHSRRDMLAQLPASF
ncbi:MULTISPECIES: hypothetical protein [Marinimicrobium]|jgi:hypothetical protein|uniref:DUF465 domain-containing protein n=1 Tax=Marinimicrobium koreense TaxID=306545 RepID=A0A3N1NU01_9GAMM|nr:MULTISPECIES: hypothetical protein [Marinimicrobium]MAN52952.1 hypothetical protein [Marinimicrobium sp.]ROQ18658.1 hypothetical protein EDC38_2886 [Marinimicrobium koreense]|tara:strand:- start:324 stop:533 length:210 start_codon:yes stop_codon:yes gene_type:complete